MSWRTRKALQEKMNAISSHILPAFLPTMRNTDIRGICRHTHIWRTHFTQEVPNCSQKPLKTYPQPQRRDLAEQREYSAKYTSGKAAQVSDKINDSFIKSQGVASGTASYSEVTKLILAYKESQK